MEDVGEEEMKTETNLMMMMSAQTHVEMVKKQWKAEES